MYREDEDVLVLVVDAYHVVDPLTREVLAAERARDGPNRDDRLGGRSHRRGHRRAFRRRVTDHVASLFRLLVGSSVGVSVGTSVSVSIGARVGVGVGARVGALRGRLGSIDLLLDGAACTEVARCDGVVQLLLQRLRSLLDRLLLALRVLFLLRLVTTPLFLHSRA